MLQYIQQQLTNTLKQKVRFVVVKYFTFVCIQHYTVEEAIITPTSSSFKSNPTIVIVGAVHFSYNYTCTLIASNPFFMAVNGVPIEKNVFYFRN